MQLEVNEMQTNLASQDLLESSVAEPYATHVKRRVSELLGAVGLDVSYHRGSGTRLFYKTDMGREREVLDCLGGYGSLFFGHNNPLLTQTLTRALFEQRPFATQASIQAPAGRLGQKLDQLVNARTGRHYVTVFGSTGAEMVEAALKHAEYEYQMRAERLTEEIEAELTRIERSGVSTGSKVKVTNLAEVLPSLEQPTFERLRQEIRTHNAAVLAEAPTFLALDRAFHGKTTGAVSLTAGRRYREPFQRIGLKVIFVDSLSETALEETIAASERRLIKITRDGNGSLRLDTVPVANVAAIFAEPVQGEGGIRVMPTAFLERCRKQADTWGFPLVFDEIQSGMGRTGCLLASEHQGVRGDYYILSKSLGGGITKIAALIIDSERYEAEFGVIHSSTFAEDGHSAVVALEALRMIEEESFWLNNCLERGSQIRAGLAKLKDKYPGVIREVTGLGLMIGVELSLDQRLSSLIIRILRDQDALGYVVSGFMFHEFGIRVAPTMSKTGCIRIQPPALITPEECYQLLQAWERLIEILYKQNTYALLRFLVEPGTARDAVIDNFATTELPRPQSDKLRKVAFIGHYIDPRDLALTDPSLQKFTRDELAAIIDRCKDIIEPAVIEVTEIISQTGERVLLHFIGLFQASRNMSDYLTSGQLGPIRASIDKAVGLARDMGCQTIGFGGYSSIVTDNCAAVRTGGIALTTGNSLTAAMGVEALMRSAAEAGIDMSKARLAAVGAGGNICGVTCQIMAEVVPSLVLVGRPGHSQKLEALAAEIYAQAFDLVESGQAATGVAGAIAGTETMRSMAAIPSAQRQAIGRALLTGLAKELGLAAPITISSSISALKSADLIITASNTAGSLIHPEHLAERPVVICDVALPPDTDPSVSSQRPDVRVIFGGNVRLPRNPDFQVRGVPLPRGHGFACMCETLVLGLSGITTDFSIGRITKEQVKTIHTLAKMHGFGLGETKTLRSI